MRQSSQVGSIIAYVGIAVVLAGLLIGGVYLIRQQTAQKPSSAETVTRQPSATQGAPEQSKEGAKTGGDSSASTETTQGKEEAMDKNQATQPASDTSSQSPTVELPQTGGSEMLYAALVAGILTGIGVAYVQSRRQVIAF